MRIINTFLMGQTLSSELSADRHIDSDTGAIIEGASSTGTVCTDYIEIEGRPISAVRIVGDDSPENVTLYYYDKEKALIGSTANTKGTFFGGTNAGFGYIAVEAQAGDTVSYELYFKAHPLYKDLLKQYKRESNERFFRESLNGKITFLGEDYSYISGLSIDTKILLMVWQDVDGKVTDYMDLYFTKMDCSFNHFAHSVEVKTLNDDRYTAIIGKSDNKYDLFKIGVPQSPVNYTKRAVYQAYILGSSHVTNYVGGAYWETEVEPVNSLSDMANKYHFALGGSYEEVTINETNASACINGVFDADTSKNTWDAKGYDAWGDSYGTVSIDFQRAYGKGNPSPFADTERKQFTIGGKMVTVADDNNNLLYDIYSVKIILDRLSDDKVVAYHSDRLFAYDSSEGFALSLSPDLKNAFGGLKMVANTASYTPQSFYLDSKVVIRHELGRIICDTKKSVTKDGRTIYSIPTDDFACQGGNYTKCIGVPPVPFGKHNSNTLVVSDGGFFSDSPCGYGVNDFGKYFVRPYIPIRTSTAFAYPFSPSDWVNSSRWIAFNEYSDRYSDFVTDLSTTVSHSGAFALHDIIQSLLKKMGTDITFSNTAEYSRYFYGDTRIEMLSHIGLMFEPKSNALKSSYTAPSTKCEISFKELMKFLRDAYRAYWYIDEDHRMHIEHEIYFELGGRYDPREDARTVDLRGIMDPHTGLPSAYSQSTYEYDTADLAKRYEFNWSDPASDMMGNGAYLEYKGMSWFNRFDDPPFLESAPTESVTISGFSADIDRMLVSPSEFSKDGMAVYGTLFREGDSSVPRVYMERLHLHIQNKGLHLYEDVYCEVNNFFASLLVLLNRGTYSAAASSRYEMRSDDDEDPTLSMSLRRCMKSNVRIPTKSDPDTLSEYLVPGDRAGIVESLSVNLSTRATDISLTFFPE